MWQPYIQQHKKILTFYFYGHKLLYVSHIHRFLLICIFWSYLGQDICRWMSQSLSWKNWVKREVLHTHVRVTSTRWVQLSKYLLFLGFYHWWSVLKFGEKRRQVTDTAWRARVSPAKTNTCQRDRTCKMHISIFPKAVRQKPLTVLWTLGGSIITEFA